MAGALAEVGKGKLTAAAYGDLLEAEPGSAGPAAPARGLTLMSVHYPEPIFSGLDSESCVC